MIIEREVLKKVLDSGTQRMMGKGLKSVEIWDDDRTWPFEFVWGNGRILGLFMSFEQFTDYIFGGRKNDGLYYFHKEDGEPYSPRGYDTWTIMGKHEILKKWHPHLQGNSDAFAVQEGDDWVFIFPDGSIIDEVEVLK